MASSRGQVSFEERSEVLARTRSRKMARSPHAFVRGNTEQFYEWLASLESSRLPHGPPVWICGDAHVGNLGPVADADGAARIQIRDLDQTVIGNPAHDIIRLGLSLASAARGSNLPGVTTARILEAIIEGYDSAFEHDFNDTDRLEQPASVRVVMKESSKRTWKRLAKERIGGARTEIPLGKRFWPLTDEEHAAIRDLFADPGVARLATLARSRADDTPIELLDSAYWLKGCSSLGRLRYAVLVRVDDEMCLIDIKEAVAAAAPAYEFASMPVDDAERVVEGARQLTPDLGQRMQAAEVLARPVFVRELLPQDLKIELEELSGRESMRAARFLAAVVGGSHARQMDTATRTGWRAELQRHHTKAIDAPSWLWNSVVELLVNHESSYLEHCRRHLIATTRR